MSADEADAAGADDAGELLVWPWTGILSTTAADEDADAAATLAFHAHRRFAGVATTALREEPTTHQHRQQHFLLLHFGKSWAGLRDAMSLAAYFTGAGRRRWQRRGEGDAGCVFGWAAVREDLIGDGAVGRFLRESGTAARSVEDIEKDEASAAVMLGAEEMEAINAKVIQLEKQLEQKEAQESAICLLNTKLQAEENLKEAYGHLHRLVTISKECLEQERERFQNVYIDLAQRDQLNRDELQETRQEVIKCLESMMISDFTVIGIKRMGQLDEKPFHHACKRKYSDNDPDGKAARLVSSWQEELKNKSWNPFTTFLVDGEEKDVVNEDDPKLRQLWTEYGDNVCNAVKVTLTELNDYSPRGRHAVNELWNFREGRKATMAEVVKYIFEQLKTSS
uniref:Factor of DNA methylation 1-5/IDN2 domain-containing protein n=1 Tax=Setaria viridis TaxID=4556 RepID=A0A4U6UFL5_SETVI|nr:hypothetical protein SEVIR_5G099700v2 [Setaria viridis]